ncbi:unnamed protein product [Heligmosomoides polygyrus]|uniref:Reverse transcriptase n=1 Tax=Heligmosomoides polygyrus TaxID=6339 RepID=A0A183FUL5_HELPZ|nr:unnamed protein product [Heligmosomoides polygyrus]
MQVDIVLPKGAHTRAPALSLQSLLSLQSPVYTSTRCALVALVAAVAKATRNEVEFPVLVASLIALQGSVTAIRPGPAVNTEREAKKETAMLRWRAVVNRMERVRNDVIRQKFGVAPIADKTREARLRWYGHALRGKEDSVRKIGLKFEVIRHFSVGCA